MVFEFSLMDMSLIFILYCHNSCGCENIQLVLDVAVMNVENVLIIVAVDIVSNTICYMKLYTYLGLSLFADVGLIVFCPTVIIEFLIVVVSTGYFVQRFCIVLVILLFVTCMFHPITFRWLSII